ncbi:MAG: TonB-dependent receptor [Proteobacteria bacterium]|nr:TonB-dependent receptor [Pseudomonadota bacterium]
MKTIWEDTQMIQPGTKERQLPLPLWQRARVGNQWVILVQAAILASCLLTAGMALAQHEDQPPVEMEAITVTAERISEYVKNHPQEVTVLGRKEILERNILGVEEALGVMPGVDVRRSAGIGARISIRGSGKTGGVLVLLNGRPLNTSQYGSVDLSTLSIDTIESITVFKPPVPVWLGAGASEGTISIVTHDSPSRGKVKPSQTRLRFSGGSFGLAESSVSRGFRLKNGNVMLTAAGSHRDGKRDNAGKDNGTFSLHGDRETQNGTRLSADGRFYTAEYGSPGPTDNPTPDARQKYQKGSLDTRIRGIIGETGDYALNAYGDIIALKDKSQSGMTASQDYIKLGIKPETQWSDAPEIWGLRVGGILEREDVDQTLSGEHHRVSSGLSVQYDRHFNPIDGTLGLRCDHTSDFGFNPGGSAGLGYGLSEKLLAKINAGYSVNVPTFSQLYQPSHGAIDQVRGNPDLDSEKIRSFDLGLEYRSGKDRVFQIAVFRADTRDLISYQRGNDLIYRPVNIDNAYRQGIELTIKQVWENGLGVDIGCILQDSENRETGNQLPYTPRGKVKTTVKYTIPEWRTRLETTLRYEAGQFSEAENRVLEKLEDYTTMDIKMTQPFSMMKVASEWFLQVENLWDTGFEIHHGYPDDGLRFSSGFNLMF